MCGKTAPRRGKVGVAWAMGRALRVFGPCLRPNEVNKHGDNQNVKCPEIGEGDLQWSFL